jgi:transcriptional regulator with XRE-family HTH domain
MRATAAETEKRYTEKSESFALIVRALRRRANLTLQELSSRCGLAVSTISKVENGQLSPTYETILRLADGLQVDVSELFNTGPSAGAVGRRSITRRGQGKVHPSAQYIYEMLCTDLSRKYFVPQVTRIVAHSIDAFQELSRHDGEEFIYVLSGAVELYTEFYEPTRLDEGDGCYFNSSMGHACISTSKDDAVILWVTARSGEASPTEAAPPTAPRAVKSPKPPR